MEKTTRNKSLILMSSGLFVITIGQILSYQMELPDVAKGSFIGIGIGLLLTSLILGKFKTVRSKIDEN